MKEPEITITVYAGLDRESRIAERVVREAKTILAANYGLPVEVMILPVPISSDEAGKYEVPLITIEGRIVSKGKAPLISEIVDAVFEIVGEEFGVRGSLLPEVAITI